MRSLILIATLALPAAAEVYIEKAGEAPPIPKETNIPMPPQGYAYCYDGGFCIEQRVDYIATARVINGQEREILRLQQQFKALAESKGCGRLEVLPPTRGSKS